MAPVFSTVVLDGPGVFFSSAPSFPASPFVDRASGDWNFDVGEDSRPVAVDGTGLSNDGDRCVHFCPSSNLLEVSSQAFQNSHSLQVPVRHLAEQYDGSFTAVAFFETVELLQHQSESLVKCSGR